MAAGITILPVNLPAFRKRMNELANRMLSPEQLRPSLRLDAQVPLGTLTISEIIELDRLAPFGIGNPSCQFAVRGVKIQGIPKPIGQEKQHWKMYVTDKTVTHEVVWWNAGKEPAFPQGWFDLAFSAGLNEYFGRTSLQLKWLDWRPSTP